MKKKILAFFVVLVFVIIFIIFYRGLEDPNIYVPKNTTQYEIPVFNTKEFYSDTDVNSKEIFKSDKIYLVNIWSSWCLPCRKEHPLLMNLKKEGKLNILGLNHKDNKKNATYFLKELGNPYEEIFIDSDGTIAIEWGAYGVPESFLIYKKKIIKKIIGPLNENSFIEIKKMIK